MGGNFNRDVEHAKRIETFVMCNIRAILGKDVILYPTEEKKKPGEDIQLIEINDPVKPGEPTNVAIIHPGTIDEKPKNALFVTAERVYPETNEKNTVNVRATKLEVKSVFNACFLSRDNDGGSTSGTLPFELWKKQLGKGEIDKTKSPGWMYEYINPEKTQDGNVNIGKAEKPQYLTFVLTLDWEGLFPFCTIVFEFERIEAKLKTLARGNGWNLNDWNTIPPNGSWGGRGTPLEGGQIGIKNCWYIPLSEFEEFKPRIVMWRAKDDGQWINDDTPDVEQIRKYKMYSGNVSEKRLANERLEYLKARQTDPSRDARYQKITIICHY